MPWHSPSVRFAAPPTIKDVARLAGVSFATVSRVTSPPGAGEPPPSTSPP
ncbi:LacI family DNA-binding transcriptional regulator [Phycicoccus sp. Soil803]